MSISQKELTIYFRNYVNYITSSYKTPNTIRKWIMKLMKNDTL